MGQLRGEPMPRTGGMLRGDEGHEIALNPSERAWGVTDVAFA